jgi:iron complex transport system ATP-binding protein
LRTLLGAERPEQGQVTLGDARLEAIPARTRARELTMVTHGLAVDFGTTVRDLVALGRLPHQGRFRGASAEDDAAIAAALIEADVARLTNRPVASLSAGETQRVQLARALAQRPALLLLDEPTANLDLRHQLEAIAVLRAFVDRGGGALVALHELTMVGRHFDRVIVLGRGKVRGDGAPISVIDEPLIAEVFGVRARIAREGQRLDYVLPLGPADGKEGVFAE